MLAKFSNPKRSQNRKFETQKGLSSGTLRGQIWRQYIVNLQHLQFDHNWSNLCLFCIHKVILLHLKTIPNKITPEHLSSSRWKESKLSYILQCVCMYCGSLLVKGKVQNIWKEIYKPLILWKCISRKLFKIIWHHFIAYSVAEANKSEYYRKHHAGQIIVWDIGSLHK